MYTSDTMYFWGLSMRNIVLEWMFGAHFEHTLCEIVSETIIFCKKKVLGGLKYHNLQGGARSPPKHYK